MISAKVIADSKNEFGNRITTMVVTFPRIILAEFNTHRMFSRNSASSRAIPFEKMLASIKENPFIPMAYQKDHKGMQGSEYLNKYEHYHGRVMDGELFMRDVDCPPDHLWLEARDRAVLAAKSLSAINITKQLCNRLLEPFMWHTVVVTATEWENFFYLRCPQYTFNVTNTDNDGKRIFRSRKDVVKLLPALERYTDMDWLKANEGAAEIHMMALAEAMWDAFVESAPKQLKAGEWHIPFGDQVRSLVGYEMDGSEASDEEFEANCIKVATAMCARVSYTVVGEEGKKPDYLKDIELHDRLAKSGHWSPFEHCGRASGVKDHWAGNFHGFIQYRKMFKNENRTNK